MVRRAIWTTAALSICLLVACTRRNDGYCCTSENQCADVGGVIQQCPSGQLCDDIGSDGPAHTCIPDPSTVRCDQDPEVCVAPTPACVGGICVECDADEHW